MHKFSHLDLDTASFFFFTVLRMLYSSIIEFSLFGENHWNFPQIFDNFRKNEEVSRNPVSHRFECLILVT